MKRKHLIRHKFRVVCLNRDDGKCRVCKLVGEPPNCDELDVHHITDRSLMPNGGYVLENGISLCADCHWKAEKFHQTGNAYEGYHPEDLYRLISSSFEKAVKASERL